MTTVAAMPATEAPAVQIAQTKVRPIAAVCVCTQAIRPLPRLGARRKSRCICRVDLSTLTFWARTDSSSLAELKACGDAVALLKSSGSRALHLGSLAALMV